MNQERVRPAIAPSSPGLSPAGQSPTSQSRTAQLRTPQADRGRPGRSIAADRALLDQLRQMAVHQETASLLDMRAGRSTSPALATVLRERAQERRRRAERIRRELAGRGITRTLTPRHR